MPGMMALGLGALAQFITGMIDQARIAQENRAALGRTREGTERIEEILAQYTPERLVNMAGIPKVALDGTTLGPRGASAILNLESLFNAGTRFARGTPRYEPISLDFPEEDATDFFYNPQRANRQGIAQYERLTGASRGLAQNLRDRAVSSEQLQTEANVPGLTDRVAARLPGVDAFRSARLGEIGEASQRAAEMQRSQIASQYGGDLGASRTAQTLGEFNLAQQSGRAAQGVEAEAERLREQQGEFLGGIETQETQLRSALTQLAHQMGLTRDVTGSQMEMQGALSGEQIAAQLASLGEQLFSGTTESSMGRRQQTALQNLATSLQAETLNRTLPFEQEAVRAQMAGSDEARRFAAMLDVLGRGQSAVSQGAGMGLAGTSNIAQLLASYQPTFLPLSDTVDRMLDLIFADRFGGGGGGGGGGSSFGQVAGGVGAGLGGAGLLASGLGGLGGGSATGAGLSTMLLPFLASDRDLKNEIRPISTASLLGTVLSTPIFRWKYRGEDVEHVGPMAQDVQENLGVGDGRTIHPAEILGLTMGSIQELHRILIMSIESRDVVIAELRDRISHLEKQNASAQ